MYNVMCGMPEQRQPFVAHSITTKGKSSRQISTQKLIISKGSIHT